MLTSIARSRAHAVGSGGAGGGMRVQPVEALLGGLAPDADPAESLRRLVADGFDHLPLPGSGATLERWRRLAAVAAHDVALVRLYEGHADATATLAELGVPAPPAGSTWGLWVNDSGQARARLRARSGDRVRVDGRKLACCGGAGLSHALISAWSGEEGPYLVALELGQTGVSLTSTAAGDRIGNIDVAFEDASATVVGGPRVYLERPGFWHGRAGLAACWYGAAAALAEQLRSALRQQPDARIAANLGAADVALKGTAALLRDVAAAIDAHPRGNAQMHALRARAGAESAVGTVLAHVRRAAETLPLDREPRFARIVAELPRFVRQSRAARDIQTLGTRVADEPGGSWAL